MLDFADADDYDRAVDAMVGIDRWCSSTDWVLPLTAAMRPQDPMLLTTDSGWGLFDRATDADGRRILSGVDRVWGFACPVIGEPRVWAEIAEAITDVEHHVFLVPGLVEASPTWQDALSGLDPTHVLHRAGGITRCRADLREGFERWFGRRSPRFRQTMRRLRRDALHAGLVIEPVDADRASTLLDRLISIEQRSWKGAEGDGLSSPDMAGFYRLVLSRLGPQRTRCLVARLDGADVGYIVGGVRGPTYRGLQLSATEDVRSLGVGHLLQLDQIERLCDEGIGTYDLGMDIPYKRRWSDETLETTTIAAFCRSASEPVTVVDR
ncbi:MAG TPA: GNAT family N-acetyltransferase [Acidimicrobiales bacterium]|nr:GNAT family N-acetyltransferase [Acidimicrobiales bacterium]